MQFVARGLGGGHGCEGVHRRSERSQVRGGRGGHLLDPSSRVDRPWSELLPAFQRYTSGSRSSYPSQRLQGQLQRARGRPLTTDIDRPPPLLATMRWRLAASSCRTRRVLWSWVSTRRLRIVDLTKRRKHTPARCPPRASRGPRISVGLAGAGSCEVSLSSPTTHGSSHWSRPWGWRLR